MVTKMIPVIESGIYIYQNDNLLCNYQLYKNKSKHKIIVEITINDNAFGELIPFTDPLIP